MESVKNNENSFVIFSKERMNDTVEGTKKGTTKRCFDVFFAVDIVECLNGNKTLECLL